MRPRFCPSVIRVAGRGRGGKKGSVKAKGVLSSARGDGVGKPVEGEAGPIDDVGEPRGELCGEPLGERRGLAEGLGTGSSGGGGAKDPLRERDRTLSRPALRKGSGSRGSADVGSSGFKGAMGAAISASLNVTLGGRAGLLPTRSSSSSSVMLGG